MIFIILIALSNVLVAFFGLIDIIREACRKRRESKSKTMISGINLKLKRRGVAR